MTELSQDMGVAELNMFAFNQALEALKALANNDAEIIRNDDGDAVGVRWTPSDLDCHEEILWG